MRNLGRAMLRVAQVMDGLEPEEQRCLVEQMVTMYLKPRTSTERSQKHRACNGNVANNATPALQETGEICNASVATSLLLLPSSTPNPETTGANAAPSFEIPESIRSALARCPRFHGQRLRDPGFWQAEIRAHPAVDFAPEVLKAHAWMVANPTRAPRRAFARFLHNWFGRAAERLEES